MVIELKGIELRDRKFAEYIRVRGPYKWQTTLKDEACFIYWINGENRMFTTRGPVSSHGKEALLLSCGSYIDEVFSDQYEEIEAVIIHFYPELLRELFINEIPPLVLQKRGKPSPLPLKINQHDLLENYVKNLLFYINHPELGDEQLLWTKMKELFLLLSKTQLRVTLEDLFRSLFNPEEITFKNVIEANLYSGVRLQDLAYMTHRSLASFKRDFKKYYDAVPSEYFRDGKLKKSVRLLLSTQMPISDIAQECGFKSGSNFSRTFHQKYKLSPSAFRLSHIVK